MILPSLDLMLDDGVVLLDLVARFEAEDLSPASLPRWRTLLSDLASLRNGWRPDAAVFERAPRLEQWSVTEPGAFGLVHLIGTVTGHPLLPDYRVVTTSPLTALYTRERSWARTASRFYVLGAPAEKI